MIPKCPKCNINLVVGSGCPPGSQHVAAYEACSKCSFFKVIRTPEHEAELKAKEAPANASDS